jgi:hypothetical protein
MVTRSDISAHAARLLADGYGFHLVSNRAVMGCMDLAPFGLPVTALDFLEGDGPGWRVDDLMRIYNMLNAVSFGPTGTQLPPWVMIDLGLLPSAFLLVTLPPERVRALVEQERDADRRARLRATIPPVLAEAERLGFRGPIPVAGYCAAPTPAADTWVGWSLCSAIPGLATTTKGLALESYRARTLMGVAQYTNPALRIHRKFGRMRLLSATLELHPVPHTLTYRSELYEDDEPPQPTYLMHAHDVERQRVLQAKIEAGRTVYVLPPGLVDDAVPILEVA